MTKNELKKQFDETISKMVVTSGQGKGFAFHVSGEIYQKAKYSCTEDEKDFTFHRGVVLYKGFEVKQVYGI